jgi:hypothetical protein
MGRLSRVLVMPVVVTFPLLLVGAVDRPAAAQELDPPAATPPVTRHLPPETTGQPTDSVSCSGCPDVYPLGEVILQSIFGKPDPNTWRPLSLSTFFSEGWNEAWVPSPDGSGGAPRQGWINALDGNMYRLWFFTFAEGFNHSASNAYLGAYTLYTPLNRRLELITNVPFVVANNIVSGLPVIRPSGGTAGTSQSQTTFGDLSFTPRVLLHETQDFTLTAEMAVVTPTGNSPLEGKTSLIPAVGFWNNVAGMWVIRGGVGINIPVQGGGADTLISQFAVGQTLTDHDVPVVGDFTYYLSMVANSPLSNGGQTSVELTPGIRTHLGQDWYFLAGLPTPLTKARVADLGMIFWFMKAW